MKVFFILRKLRSLENLHEGFQNGLEKFMKTKDELEKRLLMEENYDEMIEKLKEELKEIDKALGVK